MPAIFLPTTQRTLDTALADIAPQGLAAATPPNRVRTAWVRFTNIHASSEASADLYIVDTGVGANANDGYRTRNYPIPFNHVNSSPDIEQKVVLTAGQKFQGRASLASAVGVSIEWVEDDA